MSISYKAIVENKTVDLYRWQCGIQGPKKCDDQPGYWAYMSDAPLHTKISMGVGHIFFEDAGTHIRLFRFSGQGNLNYYQDLTPNGEWILSSHSAYRTEDIDPEKEEEDWFPWETKEDYIKKISRNNHEKII